MGHQGQWAAGVSPQMKPSAEDVRACAQAISAQNDAARSRSPAPQARIC